MESTPSLGEYLATLRRRRSLIVGVALPIAVVAIVLAIALPDVYRSNAFFRLVSDRVADSVSESEEYADQYVLSLADRVWDSDELGKHRA